MNLVFDFFMLVQSFIDSIKEYSNYILEILSLRVEFLDINISVFSVIFGAGIIVIATYTIVKWVNPFN